MPPSISPIFPKPPRTYPNSAKVCVLLDVTDWMSGARRNSRKARRGKRAGDGRRPPTRLPCGVIAERQSKHDRQPEDGAYDHKMGAPRTVTRVHEVKDDERGLKRGNGEGDDDIERTKVPKYDPHGEPRAIPQRQQAKHGNSSTTNGS